MICRSTKGSLEVFIPLELSRARARSRAQDACLPRRNGAAEGLDWVDIHFIKSAKNKPVLDFLHAVGKYFQQSLNGGYLFRFPASVAAGYPVHPACG